MGDDRKHTVIQRRKISIEPLQFELEKEEGKQLYIESLTGNQFYIKFRWKEQEIDNFQGLQERWD